jgi:hypothetical protein
MRHAEDACVNCDYHGEARAGQVWCEMLERWVDLEDWCEDYS